MRQKLPYILLSNRTDGEKEFEIDDLVFCQSDNVKLKFWFQNGRCFTCSGRLSDYETILKPYGFYRVQQSYLVSICHIEFLKRAERIIIMKNYPAIKIRASRQYQNWDKLLAAWDKRAVGLTDGRV